MVVSDRKGGEKWMYKNPDQLHYDPDLRAVAGALAGLPRTSGEEKRAEVSAIRDMLLKQATCIGLLEYLNDHQYSYTYQERNLYRVRLLAVSQRLSEEALDLMRKHAGDDNEVPF